MRRHLTILILLAAVVSGCASFVASGPVFDEKVLRESDSATFFVYRPEHFFFAGRVPNLFVDEVDRGSLRDGGYMSVAVQPGTHTLTLRGDIFWWPVKPLTVNVNVAPNQKYFLRLGMSRDGFIMTPYFWASSDQYNFGVVQEEIGRMEILNTKLSK